MLVAQQQLAPTHDDESFQHVRDAKGNARVSRTTSGETYLGNLDARWKPDLRRARNAFEVCLALSVKERLLTEYTLECERGLARSFRHDHAKLNEFVPTAHRGSP